MKSDDVYEAFNLVNTGDPVVIERCSISASLKALEEAERMQNTPLLVMAPAPAAAEPHNTASLVSYRHRSSRPPAVALTHKQTTSHRTVPQGEKRQVRVPLLQNIAVPPRLIFLRPASFLSRHA